MIKKLGIVFLVILICPFIAGIYGILHDQFTYTISPEYFTRFKFEQFGILEYVTNSSYSSRAGVVYVGWMASWWTGIPIGIILGLTGLQHAHWKQTLKITLQAILLTIGITLLIGLIGLAYGWAYLSHQTMDEWLPKGVTDPVSFIAVGSMHNFSYLGGLIGLIASIVFQVRKKGIAGDNQPPELDYSAPVSEESIATPTINNPSEDFQKMSVQELLGRTITDINVRHIMEQGGLDEAECYLSLDNGLIIDIPFAFDEPNDEVWIKEMAKNTRNIKTLCKNNSQKVINQKILDFIAFEEDIRFDKGFIELENGYLINEITIAPNGTGHTGLWFFTSIKEVEEELGNEYRRFSNK